MLKDRPHCALALLYRCFMHTAPARNRSPGSFIWRSTWCKTRSRQIGSTWPIRHDSSSCAVHQGPVSEISTAEQTSPGTDNVITIDLYLDWIGHSPCNDVYVFSILNVRLQNHANYATMVTYCFEFSPLLHRHILFCMRIL